METLDSRVDVSVIADDLVRVSMTLLEPAHPPRLPGSFSVIERQWPNPPQVSIEDTPESVAISTPAVIVDISKDPLRIAFYNPDGALICSDSAPPEEWLG